MYECYLAEIYLIIIIILYLHQGESSKSLEQKNILKTIYEEER